MEKNYQDFYTVLDVARILRISRGNAYALANSEGFPALRINERRLVIPVDAFNRWIDEQMQTRS